MVPALGKAHQHSVHSVPYAEVSCRLRLQGSSTSHSLGVCSGSEGCWGSPDLFLPHGVCHCRRDPSWHWIPLPWQWCLDQLGSEPGAEHVCSQSDSSLGSGVLASLQCRDRERGEHMQNHHGTKVWSVGACGAARVLGSRICTGLEMGAGSPVPGLGTQQYLLGGGGGAASPSLGGQDQQWLLVTSVAEAVSFLCRVGCWSPRQQILQSPQLCTWQGVCSCHEGCWGPRDPQWQWLPGSSAEWATVDHTGTHLHW